MTVGATWMLLADFLEFLFGRELDLYVLPTIHRPVCFLGHCIYVGCAINESFFRCRCKMKPCMKP